MATIQEARAALAEEKVVLLETAGRQVNVTSIDQHHDGHFVASWSHRNFPNQMYTNLDGDEQFTIHNHYARRNV